MSRNHYGGVGNKANSASIKARELEEEKVLLLKQNQALIDSIKIRDAVIEDITLKLSKSFSEGMKEALDIFTTKLDTTLKNLNVNTVVTSPTTIKVKDDDVFVSPMDSGVELEKSFDSLGDISSSEDNAEAKKNKLKNILGGNK